MEMEGDSSAPKDPQGRYDYIRQYAERFLRAFGIHEGRTFEAPDDATQISSEKPFESEEGAKKSEGEG